jgi:hypothetical protein
VCACFVLVVWRITICQVIVVVFLFSWLSGFGVLSKLRRVVYVRQYDTNTFSVGDIKRNEANQAILVQLDQR